ncbi:tRNA-binding protein [Alienimonas chondri]|uniref:Chaperone CsaA n=1 Tax=Alienimonas chondri TaxID=2681879 RepID=A0ABX1VB45_9PLAN|nr:tRNA-binding protein [Alienimonas chondri]NNJ25102.1 putative chaperone CsaA [Alienimonas chondri]
MTTERATTAEPPAKAEASVEQFAALDLRVGTILSASPNPKARQPAYVLRIDFGPLGERLSSAQITDRYNAEALVGRQVAAVVNFPPKRIAGIKSEVLVLGAVPEGGVMLLGLERRVPDGTAIA